MTQVTLKQYSSSLRFANVLNNKRQYLWTLCMEDQSSRSPMQLMNAKYKSFVSCLIIWHYTEFCSEARSSVKEFGCTLKPPAIQNNTCFCWDWHQLVAPGLECGTSVWETGKMLIKYGLKYVGGGKLDTAESFEQRRSHGCFLEIARKIRVFLISSGEVRQKWLLGLTELITNFLDLGKPTL